MKLVKPCDGPITSLYNSKRLDPIDKKIVRPHWGVEYVSFPCVYGVSCGSGIYNIASTLHGQSIVVVVETTSPRYFSKKKKIIRQAVVYEYKE